MSQTSLYQNKANAIIILSIAAHPHIFVRIYMRVYKNCHPSHTYIHSVKYCHPRLCITMVSLARTFMKDTLSKHNKPMYKYKHHILTSKLAFRTCTLQTSFQMHNSYTDNTIQKSLDQSHVQDTYPTMPSVVHIHIQVNSQLLPAIHLQSNHHTISQSCP